MTNYVLAYKGGSMPESETERGEIMAAWGKWYEGLGKAIVDGGNPFGPSKAIAADGTVSDSAPSDLSGYTVLNAENMDAAIAMAKDCPVLLGGASIEVYETVTTT